MKNKLIFSLIFSVLTLGSAFSGTAGEPGKINLILETDLGNDMDDALAFDILYKYLDDKKVNVLAINLNKEGKGPAEYADILNTWYGYPRIPLGVVRNGAECNDMPNYAEIVSAMKNAEGNPAFRRSIKDYDALPDAHILYRKILSKAKDNSVVICSVGFSTNLIRLLNSQGDKYSPLNGYDLVKKKVRRLVTVAGAMQDPSLHEYNVVKDIPAAKVIFEQWPTPVFNSPWELGIHTVYTAPHIESDFGWTKLHPMVEAYKCYMKMPYDRPMWDPTALLFALGEETAFTLSPKGKIHITDEGSTIFSEDPQGTRQYMSVTPEQAAYLTDYMIKLIARPPLSQRK